MPASGVAVRIDVERDDYVVGVLDRLVLLRTRAPMSPAAFRALFDKTSEVMSVYGPQLFYVIIPGAPQPAVSDAARETIAELWPKVQAQATAGVIWDRNRGFTSLIVRKLVADLLPIVRHRSLLGICNDAREVIEFLAASTSEFEFDVDVDGWVEAIERFGHRYDRA